MVWKNNSLYFLWQAIRHSKNWHGFAQIWQYRQRFLASLSPDRNSVADELPWLTFEALAFLQTYLKPTHRVFEYGGGGSTLFFCKKAGFVSTVEHDADWFKILQSTIAAKGYTNWTGNLIEGVPSNPAEPLDIANPDMFSTNSAIYRNYTFEQYAKAICQYEPQSFDLILVDGRSRPACIRQSIPYLKQGGILIVDNTERTYYLTAFTAIFERDFEIILDRQSVVSYTPDFTKTLILRKR